MKNEESNVIAEDESKWYGCQAFEKGRFQRFQKKYVPVEEGQTYEVRIEGVGAKGDGVAKVDGFVVIIPNSKIGDTVKVKINAVRGNVSFADIVGN